jgi:hypothetical protein
MVGGFNEEPQHGTKQIWSKDTSDHVAAAADLLQPLLARATHFFIVAGTETHTNNHEVSIGKILRAQTNPDTGLPAFTRLHLTVHGCRCAFSHHISTATRSWTKATALAAALAEEAFRDLAGHNLSEQARADVKFYAAAGKDPLARFVAMIRREVPKDPAAHFDDARASSTADPPEVAKFASDGPEALTRARELAKSHARLKAAGMGGPLEQFLSTNMIPINTLKGGR